MPKAIKCVLLLIVMILACPFSAWASHISGIRITQTGNTGLNINVDVTGFYTTGSTETTMNLGTYYNQVPAVDWGDGNTVPRYGYGPSTGIPLIATSTVVNGIPARAYRGSFSHTYGAPGNYTIAANTSCCALTTPTYTLVTGTLFTTTFMTSTPFSSNATITTTVVQNTLDVAAVAPSFTKAFAPATVAVGVPSTLTFTIDNSASTLDDNQLDFTDNLPAGLIVAPAANVINSCTGGTVTAVAGTAVVSYTGGELAAGASCTISVDVTPQLPGNFVNTTGDLTSAFGNSGTANATLLGTAIPPPFSKVFAPNPVGANMPTTLTFTIDNTVNAADVTGLGFTDNLPGGMTVFTPANIVNGCGGTITAVDGTAVISLTGGTLSAGATCTLSVDVQANNTGDFVNTTGDLTSAFGNSGTAGDTLTVVSPPAFSKDFFPDDLLNNVISTLTFTIDNSANAVDATGLNFVDNLPGGMTVANTPNIVDNCIGGTVTALPDGNSVSYAGGTVLAGSVCTISVDIMVISSGDFVNVSGPLGSSLGDSPPGAATDSLSVAINLAVPTLSKSGLLVLILLAGLIGFAAFRRRELGQGF